MCYAGGVLKPDVLTMETPTAETAPVVPDTPAPETTAPRRPGRPRKWQDLAPGEVGTAEQRAAIKQREFMRTTRAADIDAFNRHKMELYYARAARRKETEAKLATMMTVIKNLISA